VRLNVFFPYFLTKANPSYSSGFLFVSHTIPLEIRFWQVSCFCWLISVILFTRILIPHLKGLYNQACKDTNCHLSFIPNVSFSHLLETPIHFLHIEICSYNLFIFLHLHNFCGTANIKIRNEVNSANFTFWKWKLQFFPITHIFMIDFCQLGQKAISAWHFNFILFCFKTATKIPS